MDFYNIDVHQLPWASSNWKIPSLALLYLGIVVKFGPEFMRNRNSVDSIRKFIPYYNLIQVLVNAMLVLMTSRDWTFVKFSYNNLCGNHELPEVYEKKFVFLGYVWCMLKISDFFDTFFFILLKKNSHVSFLHVYHHTTTMLMAFLVFKFIRTEQSLIYAAVNSCVHVLMYTYYFLASINKTPKWKKLVTIVQLTQFFVLMIVTIFLIFCQTKIKYLFFSGYSILQCIMYLYLFSDFFRKSYRKKILEKVAKK